jgi:TolB-like protein/Tfp pilus assembly protein PilF
VKGFTRELRRRRVFRTAGIYIVGAWLLLQVADVLFPGWGLPDAAINILFIAAVLGFPLALVFGWFFDITTHGIVRTPSDEEEGAEAPLTLQSRDYLILAALAVVGIAILTQTTREVVEMPRVVEVTQLEVSVVEEKLPNSIAVLPFANISNDPDNEYFCDGISEEIRNRLGGHAGLNVIGRNSSFQFKNSDYPLRRISDLLGARYLLQGSVRKQGDTLRISAELVDETGTQLWSDTFDRTLGGIFSIQAEIAEVVASTVVPQIAGPTNSPYEPSLEAYEYFLEGRELLRNRIDVKGRVRERLRKAIEIDPRYAAAYAELAITELFYTNTAEDMAAANELIDTALRLEPGLPRALAARAFSLLQQDDPDYAVAEIVLRDVLTRDPNMVDALDWLSRALRGQGKLVEAEATLEKAVRLDPLHGSIAANVAGSSASRGDFETAEQRLLRLMEISQPAFNTYQTLRDFYWFTGRLVDMNAVSKQQVVKIGRHYMGLSMSYALLGLWDQASYWAERTMVDTPNWFWAKFFGPTSVPYLQGGYGESLDEWDKALAGEGKTLPEMPQLVALFYGDTQALAGDFAGAIRNLEPLIGSSRPINFSELGNFERDALHSLAWSYEQVGMLEQGRPILETLDRQIEETQRLGLLHKSNDLFFYARNALLMGEYDLALQRLERAVESGWRDYYVQRDDPRWAPLADDPRYQALMAEVKTDVDRQRAEVEHIDDEEDFVAKLDRVRAERKQ